MIHYKPGPAGQTCMALWQGPGWLSTYQYIRLQLYTLLSKVNNIAKKIKVLDTTQDYDYSMKKWYPTGHWLYSPVCYWLVYIQCLYSLERYLV